MILDFYTNPKQHKPVLSRKTCKSDRNMTSTTEPYHKPIVS